MSKKHRKISLVFIGFLLTLLTIVSFAEAPEAPNQLITENPYKEVKTVEANKNREHAEMKISVNKINIDEIEGIELETGEIYVILSSEKNEKVISKEVYYIVDSLDNLSDISTINNSKNVNSIKRKDNTSIKNNLINFRNHGENLIIEKNNIEDLFIVRIDKLNGEIKGVSKINSKKLPIKEKLNGILSKDKKMLEIKLNKKIEEKNIFEKKINYIYSIENKKNRNSYKFEVLKDVKNEGGNFYEDILRITSEQEIMNDLYLLSIDENKVVQKIEIKAGMTIVRAELNGYYEFYKFLNPILETYQGHTYLWVGNFLRVNRHINGGITEDGIGIYNFSFPKSDQNREVQFELSNIAETKKRIVNLKYEYKIKESLIAGFHESEGMNVTRDSYITSDSKFQLEKKYGNLNAYLAKYNLSLPSSLGGEHYGWILANKIMFKITPEVEKLLYVEGYKKIKNITPVEVHIRFWNPTPANDIYKDIILLERNKIDEFINYIGNVRINLTNPNISGTYGGPLGRIRVYSNSFNASPLMGYLDTNDEIITSGVKNNQYKLGGISGKYISAIPSEFGGNNLEVTFNNGLGEKKFIKNLNINSSESFNGIISTVYYENNGIEVGVDYQASIRSKYATDISLRNWDLKSKNIEIKMKHPLIENSFNIKIPEFDGEVYYNKNIAQVALTEVNYPTKTLRGRFIREHSGQMGIKFNVGTKDYDLRILGKDNGKTNLKLKIPKQVTLKVRDDLGVEKEIPFYTEILTLNSGVKGENSNYYCIFAPNDGINNNSEINATIVLKTLFKNSNVSWNYITGENLNLVSIGANSTSGEKNFTIIDNVDLKMELANFNETIDVSHVDISQKVYSRNGYYGLIQNENKLILKDGSRKILETTFEELTKTKKEISEAGINIKYNYGSSQDINRNQFEFEKTKGINYNKTLRLEVHTSNGQLLYYIDFNIINKVGFEILPGKGKLDFGDFFPGDVKRAESLIEFKNPNNANINISLSPTNNYKMFKKGASISPNTTILLNDLQIKDLKKGANSTNNFKISGIATTTKDTLPGEYSGELDVIITIVP